MPVCIMYADKKYYEQLHSAIFICLRYISEQNSGLPENLELLKRLITNIKPIDYDARRE